MVESIEVVPTEAIVVSSIRVDEGNDVACFLSGSC
jgi:hypothetical protein